jgi:hypothetical protein
MRSFRSAKVKEEILSDNMINGSICKHSFGKRSRNYYQILDIFVCNYCSYCSKLWPKNIQIMKNVSSFMLIFNLPVFQIHILGACLKLLAFDVYMFCDICLIELSLTIGIFSTPPLSPIIYLPLSPLQPLSL